MASLNMKGPYTLNDSYIDKFDSNEIGNYGLGYSDDTYFYVKYVGRSDDDLNKRLKEHVGEYKEFMFSYATSKKETFNKECRNYHDFGGSKKLDNTNHPARPKGKDWECPKCKIFDK